MEREGESECSDEIQIILNMKSTTIIEKAVRWLKLKRFNKQPWWRRWTNMTREVEIRSNSLNRFQQTNIIADWRLSPETEIHNLLDRQKQTSFSVQQYEEEHQTVYPEIGINLIF